MTLISAPFKRVSDLIRQEMLNPTPSDAVLDALRDIGRRTIRRAADSKATLDDTFNQLEAFAFGVYFNGRVYRQGYLDEQRYRNTHKNAAGKEAKGAEKDRKRGKYGRSQALHEINEKYHPEHRGYVLYFTNAMWYSLIHEKWGLPIISQEIKNAVSEVESLFNVSVDVQFYEYPYSN